MTKTQFILHTAARILLGLVFFVFGLNGFFNFIPAPDDINPAAGAFMGALAATGYMFPLIKGTEVLGGAMLLSNRAVPLALVLLAPVIVNIFLFHSILQPGIGMAMALTALEGLLFYLHRDVFIPLLTTKARAE